MGVQPSHWLVQWLGTSPYGDNKITQAVVVTDTMEQAISIGAGMLGVQPSEVKATRFTSGAPAGGSS